jgi:hypothetical protein
MLLAYQGLPRIYNTDTGPFDSRWKAYYAVVTSINRNSTTYTDSCQTVYENFRLVDCNGDPVDRLQPDNVGCNNCLVARDNNSIQFCDLNTGGPCLVGIVNLGDINGQYPDNCYIEVFFVGEFQKQEVPPIYPPAGGNTYGQSTVLASLRWSATSAFMTTNNGVMLNCTNHTLP